MLYNLLKKQLNAFGVIYLRDSKEVPILISDKSIFQEKEAIFIYLHEYLSSLSLDADARLAAASLISYQSYDNKKEINKLKAQGGEVARNGPALYTKNSIKTVAEYSSDYKIEKRGTFIVSFLFAFPDNFSLTEQFLIFPIEFLQKISPEKFMTATSGCLRVQAKKYVKKRKQK